MSKLPSFYLILFILFGGFFLFFLFPLNYFSILSFSSQTFFSNQTTFTLTNQTTFTLSNQTTFTYYPFLNIPKSKVNLRSHPYFTASPCHIVYFYISDQIIDYFKITGGQLRCWSPSCDIIFLTTLKAINHFKQNNESFHWLHDYRIIFIDIDTIGNATENIYELGRDEREIMKFFPGSPRPELWWNAFKRTFYLEAYMKHFDISDIIHVETDAVWFVDPAELVPVFRKIYPSIASPRAHETNAVLTPLWVRSFKNLQHMNRYYLDKFKQYPNSKAMLKEWIHKGKLFTSGYNGMVQEMELAATYSDEMGSNYYAIMPSDPFVFNNHSINSFNQNYGVVFDAYYYGMFISGTIGWNPGFLCPRDSPNCCWKFPSKEQCRRWEFSHYALWENDMQLLWGQDENKRFIPYLDVKTWSHPLPSIKQDQNNRWPLKYRFMMIHWHNKDYFLSLCSKYCTERCRAYPKDILALNNTLPKSPLFPLLSPQDFTFHKFKSSINP